MSDDWIILIPEKAGHVPPEEARNSALKQFRKIAPDSDEINIELTEKVRFENCGANFEKVLCPDCGKEIELDWWQERMEEDFGEEESFQLGTFKLPCCGVMRTLHELRYEWPQGFTRFSLEAMNPNIGKLSAEARAGLEAASGCPLRVIYVHI